MMTFRKNRLFYIIILLILYSCNKRPDATVINVERSVILEPDYTGITIPPNIAALNFNIKEEGSAYYVNFSGISGESIEIFSKDRKIKIPEKKWRKMLQNNKGKEIKINVYFKDADGSWKLFNPITWNIATERVDPYLSYRLLYPGYESWNELSIKQRNLTDFHEQTIIKNTLVDMNCINCHSFNNGRSDDFLFHMRGSMGGTYFYTEEELKKTNLKTEEMKNGAVYPRWHPSGDYVAFSSNHVVQRFHSAGNKKVEVFDLESSLVLYDIRKNEIMNVKPADNEKYMDTYPEWSSDGKHLYFCRTEQIGEIFDYKHIRYNLYRIHFYPETRTFGETELVFNAAEIDKSISFPRISPGGRFIVLTLADYGCFPIWHKEADLYSINMETFKATRLKLNSEFTDSYHSWSSNGRWLVFSSKRTDGLTARLYLACFNENGNSCKPFVLPQKDPEFYDKFVKSYNIPEFSLMKIDLNPGKIRRAASNSATQAKWSEI